VIEPELVSAEVVPSLAVVIPDVLAVVVAVTVTVDAAVSLAAEVG